MRHVLAALFLLLAAAHQTSAQITNFPSLYSVIGVQDNDVLNIRREPTAKSEIIGFYGPHQSGIEVTGQDEGGKWLRVNADEGTGWVAAQFLQRLETGNYLLSRSLNCFGTEPFWSLDTIQGASTTFSRMDSDPLSFPTGLLTLGQGRNDRFVMGFGQGSLVLSRASCSDGMSDRQYALDASVILVEDGLQLYTGCCSIQPD